MSMYSRETDADLMRLRIDALEHENARLRRQLAETEAYAERRVGYAVMFACAVALGALMGLA